jgi:hypothetical protein
MEAPAVAAAPTPKKRKSRKKLIVLAVFLIIILGLGGAVYAMRNTLTSPVKGKVVATLPANAKQSQVELAQFDGTNFSFVHPLPYIEQVTKGGPPAGEIEAHTFISSGMNTEVLTTVITSLPSGSLNDDSNYAMRAQNSAKYKMKTTVVKNEKVTTFSMTDNEQFQQTAFWPHNGKLLTLALTGGASNVPGMTSEFNDMVQSLSWR